MPLVPTSGDTCTPYALVQSFAAARSDLVVQMSMRRSLPLALTALQRREVDVVFGNGPAFCRPARTLVERTAA